MWLANSSRLLLSPMAAKNAPWGAPFPIVLKNALRGAPLQTVPANESARDQTKCGLVAVELEAGTITSTSTFSSTVHVQQAYQRERGQGCDNSVADGPDGEARLVSSPEGNAQDACRTMAHTVVKVAATEFGGTGTTHHAQIPMQIPAPVPMPMPVQVQVPVFHLSLKQ